MTHSIYKITNNVTGKVYIGCTSLKKPYYRLAEHLRNAFNPNYRGVGGVFYTDIRKFGRENYSFSVVTRTRHPNIAKELEDKFISNYRQENLSLNTRRSAGVCSKETLKKRAKKLVGNSNACGRRNLTSRRRISEGRTKNKALMS